MYLFFIINQLCNFLRHLILPKQKYIYFQQLTNFINIFIYSKKNIMTKYLSQHCK